jgi:hypothetical protein
MLITNQSNRMVHIPLPARLNHYRLVSLESQANDSASSPEKQARYYKVREFLFQTQATDILKELLREGYYDIIISRFESGKFASDENCIREYLSALARSGEKFDAVIPFLAQSLQQQNKLEDFNQQGFLKTLYISSPT